jgi:hypothetical protein
MDDSCRSAFTESVLTAGNHARTHAASGDPIGSSPLPFVCSWPAVVPAYHAAISKFLACELAVNRLVTARPYANLATGSAILAPVLRTTTAARATARLVLAAPPGCIQHVPQRYRPAPCLWGPSAIWRICACRPRRWDPMKSLRRAGFTPCPRALCSAAPTCSGIGSIQAADLSAAGRRGDRAAGLDNQA